MTSQFDADSNLWNGVSGHKDDCHVWCKSTPTLVYKRLHDMIIRIIKYDGTEHLLSCDSFELITGAQSPSSTK